MELISQRGKVPASRFDGVVTDIDYDTDAPNDEMVFSDEAHEMAIKVKNMKGTTDLQEFIGLHPQSTESIIPNFDTIFLN